MKQIKSTYDKLIELLEQDQFELVNFSEITAKRDGTDGKLIYLMNDAVESFLVFKDVRYTGNYISDYEGPIEYHFQENEDEYTLMVKQGDSHILLFFVDLDQENHFYNYGEIGHFWVPGYEYLRILEYQIAIMQDKAEYLGIDACNEKELELIELEHFPPLNYTCYPSAPEKYIVPMEDPWYVSEKAISMMEKIAAEEGDTCFLRVLKKYRKNSSKRMTRSIAKLLHQTRHKGVVQNLSRRIETAASVYPNRTFGEKQDAVMKELLQVAEKRKQELKQKGIESKIYREEPFCYDCDSISFKVRIMRFQEGFINYKTSIEEIKGGKEHGY